MSAPGAVALPPALVPLRDRPADSALFLDYDGTLAPIVEDPAGAEPLPGVPALLRRLADRLALVAVVSGRPAWFLLDMLDHPDRVHIAGLYGMEEVTPDGAVLDDEEAIQWRPVVADAVRALRRCAPAGTVVEAKDLSVTLHWRRAPGAEPRAIEVARSEAAARGLVPQPGRMAVELRPPVRTDKGTVVARLGAGHPVVAVFGDDVGDLPAFAAAAALGDAGATVARVAVVDEESPAEVAAMADVVVAGPEEAVRLLAAVAG